MCATARRLISQNVFGQHLISKSLKGPGSSPLVKACTVMASSLVCSFTTCTLNLFKNSFNDSPWYCLTSKRSKEIEGGARLTMYCSLNSVENLSNEVMCPLGRLMNQSNVAPASVPMNNLQYTASEPPESII